MVQKLVSILIFFILIISCSKKNNETFNGDSSGNVSKILYQEGDKLIDNILNDIDYLIKEGKIEDAKKLLDELKKKVDEKDFNFYYGVILYEEGKYKEAKEKLYNVSDKLKKQSYFYLGHIARKEGKIDDAINYYQKSYKDYNNPEILSSIADAFMEKKDYKRAKEYYQKALILKPDSYIDMYYLANLYFMEKDYQKSKDLLEKIIKINPGFKKAYIGMAAVYDRLSDKINSNYYYLRALLLDRSYDKVVDFIEKNKIENKHINIMKIYSVSLFNLDLKEKLGKIIETAVKLFPEDPDILMYKALFLDKNGRTKEAKELFEFLVKKYDNNFNILASYADFIYENSKSDEEYKKAIEYYEKSLYIEPTNTSYRYKLAEIYRKRNEFDKELFHRGILYFYQGQFVESIEAFFNIKEPMDKSLFFYYVGMNYSEQGKYQDAVDNLKNAVSLRKDRRFYIELAYNYVRLGQKEKAIDILNSYPNKADKEILETLNFISKNTFINEK